MSAAKKEGAKAKRPFEPDEKRVPRVVEVAVGRGKNREVLFRGHTPALGVSTTESGGQADVVKVAAEVAKPSVNKIRAVDEVIGSDEDYVELRYGSQIKLYGRAAHMKAKYTDTTFHCELHVTQHIRPTSRSVKSRPVAGKKPAEAQSAKPETAPEAAPEPAHDPVDDVRVEPAQPALVVEAIVGNKVTLVWTNYPPETEVTYLLEVQNTSIPVPLAVGVYDGPMHTVNLTMEPGTWEAWVTARSIHFPHWRAPKSDPVTFTIEA